MYICIYVYIYIYIYGWFIPTKHILVTSEMIRFSQYMETQNVCTSVRLSIYVYVILCIPSVYICICLSVYICVCLSACLYMYMPVCLSIYVYVCLSVFLDIHTYVSMYACMCIWRGSVIARTFWSAVFIGQNNLCMSVCLSMWRGLVIARTSWSAVFYLDRKCMHLCV
jgi:hypothetical protein